MQNKGLVRFLLIVLALVSMFYLSFSIVTGVYGKRAKEYAWWRYHERISIS